MSWGGPFWGLTLKLLMGSAESIAFYSGEKHEERCASLRLVLLVAVVRVKIVWATFLALWTNFYQHATLLLPSLLTAPRYFRGEVEFGVITQVPPWTPHPLLAGQDSAGQH